MEEVIELRDYLEVLFKRWKVVVAVFLVAMIGAAVVSFIQAPVYEAAVRLIEPSYRVQAEERLFSLDERAGAAVKLYPTLAKSGVIEQQVVEALASILSPTEAIPGALLERVRVSEEKGNPSIFQIAVRADDPEKAKQIANTWAEEYVRLLELQPKLGGEFGLIDTQLEAAEQELAMAEEELVRFQEETGIHVVAGELDPYARLGVQGQELKEKTLLLASHRVAQDNLSLLLDATRQIKESGGDIADLPLELLRVDAIADRGELSAQRIKERGDDINAITALLEAEERIISDVIDVLSEDVSALQEELATDNLRLDRLRRQRDWAEEACLLLSRKARELQIQARATSIISPATKPRQPIGPKRALNMSMGGALGLLVGIFGAFVVEYLESREEKG